MSLDLENRGEWESALRTQFLALEIDSEEDLAKLGAAISKNMRDGAPTMDAEERARRLAYSGNNVRRTPGKSTIRYVRGRDREGFYIDVGPNRGAFYLAFIEYGTKFFAAVPFLRPALERAIAAWGTAGSKT